MKINRSTLALWLTILIGLIIALLSFSSGEKQIKESTYPVPQILPEPLEFHPLDGPNIAQPQFEIKIKNEQADEVLEVVATLADAKEYIKEYGQYHDDLFVYRIETGELVLDSSKSE
jgi:hypothetical protein